MKFFGIEYTLESWSTNAGENSPCTSTCHAQSSSSLVCLGGPQRHLSCRVRADGVHEFCVRLGHRRSTRTRHSRGWAQARGADARGQS